MINNFTLLLTALFVTAVANAADETKISPLTERAEALLKGQKILYIERDQYARDHHNTATLFEYGEVNEASFRPGSAIKVYDVDTQSITTLIDSPDGVVRDPEISYDGQKILFSWRKDLKDGYQIYEMNIDGSDLKQLTFSNGTSDIDPLYLPDGGIMFSSTREPKYCMCNRHIMANLYRMNGDGTDVKQVGVSTLFEGHAAMLNDGRVIYDRWEYVDRNFGDAQGLWVVNPDGTKHAIYYGNNMASPGGIIDARAIPGSSEVVCIFTSCHDRPWGAMAIIDRDKGVDGPQSVVALLPTNSWKYLDVKSWDAFRPVENSYEDPYPINKDNFLVSRTISYKLGPGTWKNTPDTAIFLVDRDGYEEQLLDGKKCLFDPMIIRAPFKPAVIPSTVDESLDYGTFYVQDVYEGTHMEGVEKGSVKWLRVVESPAKKSWTDRKWTGQGAQFPGVNWSSFETKKVLGVVPVAEDGSASFEAPAGKHLYFQVLDKDMKMIQSMRSGVSLLAGETNGCIGCHEDRLMIPRMGEKLPTALQKKPMKLADWAEKEPVNFSFLEHIQPIIDKRCMKCHDFDKSDRDKLVLARDLNPYFNAAYINLYVNKSLTLAGGGGAETMQAYSWGSHPSELTKVIENRYPKHPKVKLNDAERKKFYEWMDINGVYYPVYETAFDTNAAGRAPLTDEEFAEVKKLTGLDFASFKDLGSLNRKLMAQISFDRPEQSPCLDLVRDDAAKYKRMVELITLGKERLEATPRGDIESKLVMCEKNKRQLENYMTRFKENKPCCLTDECAE
ncbi:MAG: hypothetical protein R3Y16_01490 [Rikenellaceae bacterium]